MKISYNKLWKILIDKKLRKMDLQNLDRKGNLIYDPESCDRTTGFPSYSEFVGFYQVNVSNMI